MSANKYFVRGCLCVLLFSAMAAAAALLADSCAARAASSAQDPLSEAVQTLANEVAAIRDLRGPFHLDWQNNSSLGTAQSVALQSEFLARLSAIRGLMTEDAGAPALSVTLRETASQLVIVAQVSFAGSEQVHIVQSSRAAFSAQDAAQPAPYLRKQLLWKQREPILAAAEHSNGAASVLLILGRDTLWAYNSIADPPVLQAVAHIPGAVRPSRLISGGIRFPKDDAAQFVLELPGKSCSGALGERITLECTAVEIRAARNARAQSSEDAEATAKLLAPCDHSAWILSSADGDWSKSDRLFLQDAKSTTAERSTVLETPGPVLALAGGPEAASSVAVILNLSTGEYEVHRFALACRN